jgi:hypothetical protein
MAWQDQMALEFRYMINDLGSPPTYSDGRVQQLLVVAGLQASREITFNQTYTFDIVATGITPDPTITDTFDPDFTVLTCLKAAQILSNSKLKSSAAGIIVKDIGGSTVDTTKLQDALKTEASLANQLYDDARLQYTIATRMNGRAILTPFRVGYYANGFFAGQRRGAFQYLGFLP